MKRESTKREFLELAHEFEFGKYNIGGWFYSEKLDGIRCYYDGGISRGLLASDVPWANVEKHGRFKEEVRATGLWTRYGHVLRAPDGWLDTLPYMPLDGELTMGRGTWQQLSSEARSHSGNWDDVRYAVFNSPPYSKVFADSTINSTNYKKVFKDIGPWIAKRIIGVDQYAGGINGSFYMVRKILSTISLGHYSYWHPHEELPLGYTAAEKFIEEKLLEVEKLGGEGLMLRNPISHWEPMRVRDLLKVKTLQDAEGTIVGYRFAKPTDLDRSLTGVATDKLLGLMGSLRVRIAEGLEFDLSGFTDAERLLHSNTMDADATREYGKLHPGEEVPLSIWSVLFPRGDRITYQYRELSTDGKPKEARYLRPA